MFLTEKQLAVLNFIRDFIRDRGISPTLDEMSQYFGVSKITVYEHVSALEKKGALRKTRNLARSIELVEPPSAPARRTLEVRGRIAAGSAIEAVDNPESMALDDLAPPGDAYLLRVVGDSMIKAHICDGDLVVVQPADAARDGDIVVALLPDASTGGVKATLKRFFHEADAIRLQPENDSLKPLRVRQVQVQGRVVGVVRSKV
ncbi:MAG TPA: transcriptional repressor LexA [Planctomycetota bacterium]|nr:transcriptional repressor LexA [Planctomycetota bacterium]